MALNVSDKITQNFRQPNIAASYGPYPNTDIAMSAITAQGIACAGLTVGITQQDGSIKEYWLQPNANNNNALEFVEKQEAGQAGTNAYVHFKYAAAVPTSDSDMHPTPQTGDKYIGVYSGNLEEAPTAYTSYVWSKYVGDNGVDGQPGQNAVNPFKGWFTTDNIPTTGQAGDYCNVSNTSVTPHTVTIYRWSTANNRFEDTGEVPDTATGDTFASSETLQEVAIDDSHLVNPVNTADATKPVLAKAEDVMQMKVKLEGVTASEVKAVNLTLYNYGINGKDGVVSSSGTNKHTKIDVSGCRSVRFLAQTKSSTSYIGYMFWDENETLIYDSNEEFPLRNGEENELIELDIPIPSGAKYFLTTVNTSLILISNFYCYLRKGQNVIETIEQVEKMVTEKISPLIVHFSKEDIASFDLVTLDKFPICQYQSQSVTEPAYYGLFKNYALGKVWTSLLETNVHSNHRTYKIPVDAEKYIMCSVKLYGDTNFAPLACLVDDNDIVVACLTNIFGNSGYWSGNIIPRSARYLIMPFYINENINAEVAFIPRMTYVTQNATKSFSYITSSPQDLKMFGRDNPIFGGSYVYDNEYVYGRKGSLNKYTVNDFLGSFFGLAESKQIYKLLYVEGYDEVDFRSFKTNSYAGLFFVLDRDGKVIDTINNPGYYFNKYQLPENACFMALRGSDVGYAENPTITLRKKAIKPIYEHLQTLNGIGVSAGKLGENGELTNLSENELYWTTSYIDLSRGFTLILNSGFTIVKAVLCKTDTTVVNPYLIEEDYGYGDFWSMANPMPGYMLRLTIGLKDESATSKPITKFDSIINCFTYLDNPELNKVIPTDKPYIAFKKRLFKLINVSEIARHDQWMNHYDGWDNKSKSIPMASKTGEPKYWNTRYREGWQEIGMIYSEASEYGYYVGQNISLKTFVTAIQNKRSVMYFERINASVENNSTIGANVSRYDYNYNGLSSRYAASFYGTVCTGLTGYVMGLRNLYVSGDYMRRNANNDGPRVPNLTLAYSKYYSDIITQENWEQMIDWLQPMDFIWTPGHCSVVSDIYKDSSGKTQLIVWSEQSRPFTKSRAYTREKFQERLQAILDAGSGNGFGLLRYNGWDADNLKDDYDDDKFFSVNGWQLKSNIKIDSDITTFRGEYVTFQIRRDPSDTLNDYAAFLNVHRGRDLFDTLQIFSEDETDFETPIKSIDISSNIVFPSDNLYLEDAYDIEDWIVFDLADSTKMGGSVLSAGKYKARLVNLNSGNASGFTHFEFVDYIFEASEDGDSIIASWSDFSENATPYLIRQERITGIGFTEGSEYPSSPTNRKGQTYVYNIDSPTGNNETVYTLTTDGSWGTSYYTKIFVRGTYGTVCRRIKTIN